MANRKKAKTEHERATPESEARFPSHLSPVIQCKQSVLDRARIEFYAAVIISAIEVLLPMLFPVSAIIQSVILLLVFGPLIDIVWRSPWTHAHKTYVKISLTALLAAGYLSLAVLFFAREHQTAALTVEDYLKSERVIRWIYLIAGSVITYALLKASRLIRAYIKSSRAEELATRQKFYAATEKGWLDYELESKKSSARLHFLVARLSRRIKALATLLRLFPWFVHQDDKKTPAKRARIAAFFITLACESYSHKIEPEVRDMEVSADIFMQSTDGYLKTFSLITKDDFVQLAGLHEYFECQLKDIREIANALGPLPPALERVRGHSQESTAAINRLLSVIRSQIAILRRVEGHCARMVRSTNSKFEHAFKKAAQPLLDSLQEIVRLMSAHVDEEPPSSMLPP
jgi:hypothetical protein